MGNTSGKGTLKYRKVQRTVQTGENAGKAMWYATAVQDRTMTFDDFVSHIAAHNSPFSRGTVQGVLNDTLDCLKELILDGKSVRFGDLGLFSVGMKSDPSAKKEDVSASNIVSVHLIVRNTKNWSNSELRNGCKIEALDEYTTSSDEDGDGIDDSTDDSGKSDSSTDSGNTDTTTGGDTSGEESSED